MNKIQADLIDWGRYKKTIEIKGLGYKSLTGEGRIMEVGNVMIENAGRIEPSYWPDSKMAFLDYAIHELPDTKYIAIIYFKYYFRNKIDEIKENMDISRSSVYNYLDEAESLLELATRKRKDQDAGTFASFNASYRRG